MIKQRTEAEVEYQEGIPSSRHCYRCEQDWRPIQVEPPIKCPRCGRPYWNRPRKEQEEE